jgi:hypothetical protein
MTPPPRKQAYVQRSLDEGQTWTDYDAEETINGAPAWVHHLNIWQDVYAWGLMDGTILTMEAHDQDNLTAWRPRDPGLREILDRSGIDLSFRMKIAPEMSSPRV